MASMKHYITKASSRSGIWLYSCLCGGEALDEVAELFALALSDLLQISSGLWLVTGALEVLDEPVGEVLPGVDAS